MILGLEANYPVAITQFSSVSHLIIFSVSDSSVGIATGYQLDSQSSIPGEVRDFSLLYDVQTDSWAHPAFFPMGTGGSFP
jgi:hypothetical protein